MADEEWSVVVERERERSGTANKLLTTEHTDKVKLAVVKATLILPGYAGLSKGDCCPESTWSPVPHFGLGTASYVHVDTHSNLLHASYCQSLRVLDMHVVQSAG